jgi:hypothetical protein
MTLAELSAVMVEQNKEGFKTSATRRSGKIFNDRVINLIKPRLPLMVKAYADTDLGRFVIANTVAAAIVKFGATNEKLLILADAGIQDAADDFLGSFNLEEMVNDLIDGIDVSGLTNAADNGREATASGLRMAADVVDTDRSA